MREQTAQNHPFNFDVFRKLFKTATPTPIAIRGYKRLKDQCPSRPIAKIVRAAKGNRIIALLKKSLNVNITSDDLVSVGQLQTDIMLMRTQQDGAQTAIDEMENEIDLLKAELIDLREKEENLKDNLKNESTKSSNILQTNELLQWYIESLTGKNENSESRRKRSNISDTTRECQLRKLKGIKSRAQCAMWFLDNFRLKLDSLDVSNTNCLATRKSLKISSNIFNDL